MKNKKKPNIKNLLKVSRDLAKSSSLEELSPTSMLWQAIQYHYSTSGSEARASLCISASLALGLTSETAVKLAAAVETLHNASLIQDDFQDQDKFRRGQLSVWSKFGSDIAINITDLLIANAFSLAASAAPNYAYNLISIMKRAIAVTLQGQTNDLITDKNISIDEGILIAKEKSGPFFSLSLELPLVVADQLEFLDVARQAGASFGIGYQIFDDLNDFDQDKNNRKLSNLFVLSDSNSSKETAEDLALYFLNDAASYAAVLPDGCGSLLKEKCSKLLSQLNRAAA
jgi:geranylgeranyl pyrophosphate synthase